MGIGDFALPANTIKCADKNQVGNKMGQGFTIKCEKCGTENSYLQGIGFMYYSFLERTKEDVIKGKFGKDAKAFFTENPDCEVDARNEVYLCPECGYIKQGVDLKMKTVDKEYKKVYRCGKCRSADMKPIKLDTERQYKRLSHIPCPKCNDKGIKTIGMLMWD